MSNGPANGQCNDSGKSEHSAPIRIDFAQKNSFEQAVRCKRAILSSRSANWTHLHLEYHQMCAHATPEHYPAQHVVAIQTEGTVLTERRLGGTLKRQSVTVGDICVVPSHTPHWVHAKGQQGLIFLCLSPDFLKKVAYEYSPSHAVELIPHFAKSDPFIYQLAITLREILRKEAPSSQFYIDTLSTALAAHLLENYSVQSLADEKSATDIRKVKEAIEYINDHLSEPLSLEAIASSIDISQYHFCRMFKSATGQSPWQYVIQQRIEMAKQLLKNPKNSVSKVARQTGFSTQGQFSNFFRRHVGVSPKTYRENL